MAPDLSVLPKEKPQERTHDSPAVKESQLLTEIERDMDSVSPAFADMTHALRRYASAALSSNDKLVLAVASARAGEGCTTIALGLAAALAEIHDNVVLIETERDMTAGLTEELGLEHMPGLAEYLRDALGVEDIVRQSSKRGLSVIPAGRALSFQSPLEGISGVRKLVNLLRLKFDIIILDLAPLLESEEAPALIRDTDGVVIVVAAGQTSAIEVERAITLCKPVAIKGVILNKVDSKTPRWMSSLFIPEGQRSLR